MSAADCPETAGELGVTRLTGPLSEPVPGLALPLFVAGVEEDVPDDAGAAGPVLLLAPLAFPPGLPQPLPPAMGVQL